MTETARKAHLTITSDGVIFSRDHKICTVKPGEQVTLEGGEGEYVIIIYRCLQPKPPLAKVRQFKPRKVQP